MQNQPFFLKVVIVGEKLFTFKQLINFCLLPPCHVVMPLLSSNIQIAVNNFFFNAVFEKFTSIYLKQITSKYKLKPFKLVWMEMFNFSIFGKGCKLFTLVVAHSEGLIGTFKKKFIQDLNV